MFVSKKHFFCFFSILIIGCSSVELTSVPSPTVIAQTPSATQENFPTLENPTSEINFTRLKNVCLNIETKEYATNDWSQEKPALSGSLVLNKKGQIYLINVQDGSRKIISNNGYLVAISPDRNKLAYIRESGTILIINNIGKTLTSVENSDKSLNIQEWLDNEKLIVEDYGKDENDNFQASLIILNPDSGEKQEFLPFLPDMRYTPNEIMWTPSLMLPNNELTRLIYPTWEEGFALWNIENETSIAQFSWLVPVFQPIWSPDGGEFVQSVPLREKDKIHFDDKLPYVGGDDILSVDKNGKVKRITFLTTMYPAQQRYLTWSPDGKKIAFWLYLNEGSIPQLSVVDVETSDITNYCLGPSTDYYSWSSIFWSPDGIQLAFTQDTPEKNIVIVDTNIESAFYITSGADLEGWMTNNP